MKTKITETFTMTHLEAMKGLKNGKFEGCLVEFSTDEYGITTVVVTTEKD